MGEPTRRTISARETSLEVLEAGAGGRPLLVLHGFCGSKENFEDVLEPIGSGGWHVVVPDQRGHGESSHPRGEPSYSFEAFAADALALADALGWGRFVLMGHSMGGRTAQLVAVHHSERLEGLVLMDTFHGPLDVDAELLASARTIVETRGLSALVDAMRSAGDPLATEAHLRLLGERPGYQEFLDAQTLACSPDMWTAMSQEMSRAPDLLDRLRRIRVPTLVVVGEQDEPFLASCTRIAKAMPRARLEVVARGGHSPQLEAPEAWLEAVTGFLGSLND